MKIDGKDVYADDEIVEVALWLAIIAKAILIAVLVAAALL